MDKKISSFSKWYSLPEHKAKFLEKYNKKEKCSCGSMVSRLNRSNHLKTNKHKLLTELYKALQNEVSESATSNS